MNNVIFLGRLVGDVESRKTASGITAAKGKILVKTSRRKKDNNKYINSCFCFEAYGSQADSLVKYCKDGDKILLQGEMINEKFEETYFVYLFVKSVDVFNKNIQSKKEKILENLDKKLNSIQSFIPSENSVCTEIINETEEIWDGDF